MQGKASKITVPIQGKSLKTGKAIIIAKRPVSGNSDSDDENF